MIKFHCPSCSQKLGVPDDYAGKRIRCSKCSQPTLVPRPEIALPPTEAKSQTTGATFFGEKQAGNTNPASPSIELQPHSSGFESINLPLPDPNLETIRYASRMRAEREEQTAPIKPKRNANMPDETAPKPHWYWPFLFPIKGAALGMIGVFILCEVVLGFVAMLPIIFIGLVAAILMVIVRAYIYWYLYLCVQTAASGELKSPDILQEDEGSVRDMINRMLRMGAASFVCFAPAVIYLSWKISKLAQDDHNWSNQIDSIFWTILAAGLFIFPMALLSVIMNDSLAGLNPVPIVWSIVKMPIKYIILVACFSIPLGLSLVTNTFSDQLGYWFALPAEAISYYLAFVGAAMLGRFFYLNEQRLNWDI